MTKFLSNAFSLQMLDLEHPVTVEVAPVSMEEALTDTVSVVGHADTAAVLGVPFNRSSVRLDAGDVLYVAQLVGGRLPEGATTLPDGFSFKFVKVEVK